MAFLTFDEKNTGNKVVINHEQIVALYQHEGGTDIVTTAVYDGNSITYTVAQSLENARNQLNSNAMR